MSCCGGRRQASSSSARWPLVCAFGYLQLQLVLVVLLFSVETWAVLTAKFPDPSSRWLYNGTHASQRCETALRCDLSSSNRVLPACSCHPNCSLYDACCEDIRPSDWHQRVLPLDAYECAVYPLLGTDATGKTMTLSTAKFVFLITKCPSTYRVSSVAKLCIEMHNKVHLSNESLREQWVTESTTGITYSNQFCALCNGVPANRMIFWKVHNGCIDDPAVALFGLSGCKLNVLLNASVNMPACTGRYHASCINGAPQQMQNACINSPAKYIYDKQNFVTYRNYNCSLCSAFNNSGNYECRPYEVVFTTVTLDLQGLLVIDSCPKKLTTFASKDDRAAFNEICPDTVFDTANCSETLNMTAFLALYSANGTWAYRITPAGVQAWSNDSYSMCYACQPNVTYNYTLQPQNVTTAYGTYNRPFFQVEVDGSVTVCSDPQPIKPPSSDCIDLPSEVSVVLMSLSLVGLALYAVAYLVLPSLQNLPGQIVLHQSAAFFAAFLLWLLRAPAGQSSEACIAVGVLTHFFFIAAFTWTTVYAFEVVRALGFQAYGAGYTKRRLRYILSGWLVPTVITVIAIAVNWAPPGEFDPIYRPAYGAPQCFINSWTSQRIFFLAPLAVFLLIDVVIYAYVIVQLVVISGQTKLVRENHHEKLLLAVKLVFALGITWIFAVLATATENCYTRYIFVVLNSLQGVFLFLIFICNAKTSGQIHQKVRSQKSLTSGITTGVTVSSRESSSSTTSIISKRKSVLGVKSFSPVSLAMEAREHVSKPPPR